MNRFLCFHLVWASLAFITACIHLGMLLIRFLQTSFILSLTLPSLTQGPCALAGGTPQALSSCLGCCHRYLIEQWQVAVQATSRHWLCSVWTILGPSWGCVWGFYPVTRQDLAIQPTKCHSSQKFLLKNAGVELNIYSSIYLAHMPHSLRGCRAPTHW